MFVFVLKRSSEHKKNKREKKDVSSIFVFFFSFFALFCAIYLYFFSFKRNVSLFFFFCPFLRGLFLGGGWGRSSGGGALLLLFLGEPLQQTLEEGPQLPPLGGRAGPLCRRAGPLGGDLRRQGPQASLHVAEAACLRITEAGLDSCQVTNDLEEVGVGLGWVGVQGGWGGLVCTWLRCGLGDVHGLCVHWGGLGEGGVCDLVLWGLGGWGIGM